MNASIESTAPVPHKRRLKGVVVSRSGDKSVVVKVSRLKIHPRYKKRINWSKKYLVHDERNTAEVGAEVQIVECRPYSRRKHFRLSELASKNSSSPSVSS